ncbi:MAG: tRNA (N6-threonylcarbamoyladenosine(37)-N6)-methyltransferase TrmO [Bacteroidales bacterium]
MSRQTAAREIIYEPIGIFHSPYTQETGAPRQGILKPDVKAKIEIFPEYHDALDSLNQYEYIVVLYHFDRVADWSTMVTPPGADREFGLFATRTPRRPNPIGFSVLKLEKVENGILHISGTDAFNGTNVLDIKPYIPSLDRVESSTG